MDELVEILPRRSVDIYANSAKAEGLRRERSGRTLMSRSEYSNSRAFDNRDKMPVPDMCLLSAH